MGQHLREIELRRHFHAKRIERVTGFGKNFRRMKKRLGRNAANIQAGATEGLALFHHRNLKAKLGSLDRGHITAGARADDNHIVRH